MLRSTSRRIGNIITYRFRFDEQEGVRKDVEAAWDLYLSTIPQEIRERTGQRPIWGKSHRFMPLQAADILVYWYRARLTSGGSFNDQSSPFPWLVKKDLPRLLVWFDEHGLRQNLKPVRNTLNRLYTHNNIFEITYSFNGEPLLLTSKS